MRLSYLYVVDMRVIVMNRKTFRELSKQGQLLTLDSAQHMVSQSEKRILTKAVTDYSAVMALCLKTKLGFGHVRTVKFLNHVGEMFQDIQDGRISIEDVKKQLHEEVGILIK